MKIVTNALQLLNMVELEVEFALFMDWRDRSVVEG
jgi:hypothetical protein